ncbi:hypothetical protein ABFY48_09615 [Lysinibacillus pakistanensis]|uniref:hypothetical protein n=1 Tax=Lysinibacillus pakistanensis TaxID=759811 RepID=UPI003D2827AE
MELKVIHSVELPFILNLPNDIYEIKLDINGANYQIHLNVSNTAYKVITTYQGKEAYIIVNEDEINTLSEKEKKIIEKN